MVDATCRGASHHPSGSTAIAGADYEPLPHTLVIPAGKYSASVDLIPLYDGVAEPEERFQIKAIADPSIIVGSPFEASVIIEASAVAPEGILLVEELFGGASSSGLNGKITDLFDASLINAGGSATWLAGAAFRADGSVTTDTAQNSASLNLGTFINSHKGQVDGKFVLTASISETVSVWISLGFSQLNSPSTTQNFSAANGVATVLYRAQNASPAGEIDLFPILNSNVIDGPDGNIGTRTLSVILDLTPSGGYNGTTNHGTVTWVDRVLGTLGSHTYTANANFGSILLSEGNSSTGSVSALSLRQIQPIANTYATWISGFGLALADQDFNDDPDADGVTNGIEAWLGTHPGQPSTGLTVLNANTFVHARSSAPLNGLVASYQWSPNLIDWYPSDSGPSGGPTVTINVGTAVNMTDIATSANGTIRRMFLRLVVSQM
jgi:hypothetical protein